MVELKDKLVNKLIAQIIADAQNGDTSVLAEILEKGSNKLLIHSLPEEEWGEFQPLLDEDKVYEKIKSAREILVADTDEEILEMISLIEKHPDEHEIIDYIDGVVTWENLNCDFTCKKFCLYIS